MSEFNNLDTFMIIITEPGFHSLHIRDKEIISQRSMSCKHNSISLNHKNVNFPPNMIFLSGFGNIDYVLVIAKIVSPELSVTVIQCIENFYLSFLLSVTRHQTMISISFRSSAVFVVDVWFSSLTTTSLFLSVQELKRFLLNIMT